MAGLGAGNLWNHREGSRKLKQKGPGYNASGASPQQRHEPLEYEVMVRSTYRHSLIFPVLLLSLAAYAQPSAVSQIGSAGQSQALPDDPGTTAHIQAPAVPDGPIVVFDTSMGRMTCGLFSREAPATVANFIGLATGSKTYTDPVSHQKVQGKPLYDGTTFHRVIPGFMIQGGDPTGTGSGDPGYFVNDEIVPNLNYDVAGRLAMANEGPNTNGSQFFITVAPQPSLDQHYTIFGQCDPSSVQVAESITQVPRDPHDKPLEPVYLNKVTIVQPGQAIPPPPQPAAPPTGAPGASPPSAQP